MAKPKNLLQDARKRKVEELLRAQQHSDARILLEKICQQNPRDYESWLNLGALCGKLGEFDAAEAAFKKAVALRGDDPQLYINLARLCDLQERYDDEIIHCQHYLCLRPNDSGAHAQIGRLQHRLGRLSEAEQSLREALRCSPDSAAFSNNLGIVLYDLGRYDEALTCYQTALRLNPRMEDAYCNLGNLYQIQGETGLAETNYLKALEINPQNASVCKNLGILFLKVGRDDDALIYFHKALRLDPTMEEPYFNIGYLYVKRGESAAAEAIYAAALKANPLNTTARLYFGCFQVMLGRYDEAMQCFDEVLRIDPVHAGAHGNRASLQLMLGNFRDGWREYEWRFQYEKAKSPEINALYASRSLWDGTPLSDKTLLVYAEQGFGDTLQFCRYLPLVRQRVEKVLFKCQPELMRLLSGSIEGVEFISPSPDHLLPTVEYEMQIPLLSLPRLFETEIGNIPNQVPYIHADPELTNVWRKRLDTSAFKVGLVWAGRPSHSLDHERSLRLELLAPLGRVENVCFYALQKGQAASQIETTPSGMRMIRLSDELEDFATTAAVIANLDLVITVDTSVAHLAGAMGKPVWTLIYSPPDWRWLLDREDSPWYPTMRLFRREVSDGWGPVVEQVALELEKITLPT